MGNRASTSANDHQQGDSSQSDTSEVTREENVPHETEAQPSSSEQQPAIPTDSPDAREAASVTDRLPAAIDLERATVSEASNALQRFFQYTSTFQARTERTLRSASAIAGGLVRDSANWLLPSAFNSSKSYSIFVQKMFEYVANDLASVRRVLSNLKGEPGHEEVLLARKTVGNLLDMTALATFHFSPLTVLAIFGSLAYRSNIYLHRLCYHLQEHAIVEPDAVAARAGDLLELIRHATDNAERMFECPPISLTGLEKTIHETDQVVRDGRAEYVLPFQELDQFWRQMELAASQQQASIWDVSATVSIVVLDELQSRQPQMPKSMEIPGDLFEMQITSHYWQALRRIEREGIIQSLSKACQPYLETVWSNFTIDRRTWTEQLLSGELLKWRWSQLAWPKLTRGTH